MTLDDFEKELLESQKEREHEEKDRHGEQRHKHRHRDRDRDRDRDREGGERSENGSRHQRHHPHDRHRSSRHRDEEERHRHKRSRHSTSNDDDYDRSRKRRHRRESSRDDETEKRDQPEEPGVIVQEEPTQLRRDAWMEAPSALDVDYVQRRDQKEQQEPTTRMLQADFGQKLHDRELNRHLHDVAEDNAEPTPPTAREPAEHSVDYTFGDAGSQWRMTKLKAVYRQADETGQKAEDIAIDRFGDLRSFDDAREEEVELDRRETYGEGYVGKEKPTGELFQERKLDMGLGRGHEGGGDLRPQETEEFPPQGEEMQQTKAAPTETKPLDSTALNRLKAQMMKAKLRGSSNAAELEAQYNVAMSEAANRKESDVVVLGKMDNRMLAGEQRGEAKPVETKRGRERGLVEENQDMSIDDMVREERRTRGQAGGEGQRFAERIAKDSKFDVSYAPPVLRHRYG